MMLRQPDNFYLKKEEPLKSCLLALRDIILNHDKDITKAWKYGMPFFCYEGKMFCYLWVHKKFHQPYIGIVEGKSIHHPLLLSEKRARMKILLIDAERDIPVKVLNDILRQAVAIYKKKV